jgi:hypothetical protein
MICDRILGILKRFCLKMIGHDTTTPNLDGWSARQLVELRDGSRFWLPPILEIILESPGGPVVVSKICVQSEKYLK